MKETIEFQKYPKASEDELLTMDQIAEQPMKCPFCGNSASIVWAERYCVAMCSRCGCRTPRVYFGVRRNYKGDGSLGFHIVNTSEEARETVINIWDCRYRNEDEHD